ARISACTLCATFCSSVSCRSRSWMRASIFGSGTTGPAARCQTMAVRAGDAGRACAEASRAQPAAGIPPQDMARTSVSKRFMARRGPDRESVTDGRVLEAHLHANSKRPRWIEDELLSARVDRCLSRVGFVRHVVDEPLDADVALFVYVADAEIQVGVAVDPVIESHQVGPICGGDSHRVDPGHLLGTVVARSAVERCEEL